MKQRTLNILIGCGLAGASSAPFHVYAQTPKKTVAELLAQARESSRGGNVRMQKGATALPQSQVGFKPTPGPNLESVKPPRSSDLMKSEADADHIAYNRILDRQIAELFKLSERFAKSSNRGEMWLRLAELYVEKATILDDIAQDEYDKRLRAFQAGQTKVKPHLEEGEAREYNRKAVKLYEWFERDFPKDEKIDQAYFFLGFNYFELGNPKKGVEYYDRLTQQFPNSGFVKEAYFALGEYYFENEKWAQAYKEYTPLLRDRHHRLHTFALYKSAWCLFRMGKNADALKYLETIIKAGRQETGGSLAGKRTVNRSRLESEALKDLPTFYAAVGTPENAPPYFKGIVQGDPNPYLEKLAYYYTDKGNRDGSDSVFKYLISQNRSQAKAFEYQYQIVQNYFYAKNSPKFREELYRWVNDYGNASVWAQANKNNKELIANSQKLRETTLRNWTLQEHQTAQNSRAPYSQAAANEGYQLYMKEFGNFETAADMHFYYGELLYDMGKYDEAAAQYQAVVEKFPKSKFVDKAATNLILAVDKGVPDDKQIEAKRGNNSLDPIPLDSKSDRFVKAGKWYAAHFPTGEKTPEIRFRIGRLYYQNNQFDPATTEFKEIVQKYPKTKYAEYSANLLLDIYNLRKDYAGLEKAGTELLAVPSIAQSKAGADIRGVLEKASFKRAQDLEGNKAYGESGTQFENFATQNPKSDLAMTALFNAGVNYERAGDTAKAQSAYGRLLASNNPKAAEYKPRVRRLMAKLAQESYQIEEAARAYKQAALDNPKDPLAANMMYNAALLEQVLGHNDEATRSYTEFQKMNRKSADNLEATFSIAKLQDKAGHLNEAANRYKEYIDGGGRDAANLMDAYGRLYEINLAKHKPEAEAWRKKIIVVAKRLTGEEKKFDASWPAKAKLGECEETFKEMKAIKFPRNPAKLKSVLGKKVDVLNRLVRETGEVIAYNSANEIVEALNLAGRAYDHMAEALRDAPMPPGLSADEQKQYHEGVEKTFVEPNLTHAREFHEKAVQRASELDAYPEAYRSSWNVMNRLDPKKYYDGGELPSESHYLHWMAP